MIIFQPQGVCCTEIRFENENGRIGKVEFVNGCPGNLEAISRMVAGMTAEEIIAKCKGIVCQNGTSCADQFAIALEDLRKTL